MTNPTRPRKCKHCAYYETDPTIGPDRAFGRCSVHPPSHLAYHILTGTPSDIALIEYRPAVAADRPSCMYAEK